MMNPTRQRLNDATTWLKSRYPKPVDLLLVLGSGLGELGDALAQRDDWSAIPYDEIPYFPHSSVEGHAGRLLLGSWKPGFRVACLQGRYHYYEGHPLDEVVFPHRVIAGLGAKTMVVSNAAGGMGEGLAPGDLMLITDHLNMTGLNPLIGPNDPQLGPRFFDMGEAYAPALQEIARSVANELGQTLKEGVYAWMTGPSYETPAEVRMLKQLGASAVGMSTVPEVLACHHMGMSTLGISCITNYAAGIGSEPLNHQEVMEIGARAGQRFIALVGGILDHLADNPAG